VPSDWRWLETQSVFCLTTREGALDVFREVLGLEGKYAEAKSRGISTTTAAAVPFTGLSDEDMLQCQEALAQVNASCAEWKCSAMRFAEQKINAYEPGRAEEKRRAEARGGLSPGPTLGTHSANHHVGRGQPAAPFPQEPAADAETSRQVGLASSRSTSPKECLGLQRAFGRSRHFISAKLSSCSWMAHLPIYL
jgi:hypothetical protein